MVDMAAIAAAASALKNAYDISKAALGMRDAALVQSKIGEMQGEISSALASAIAAQTDQMAMLRRIGELEKEVVNFETWKTEKERYELKELAPQGIYAYAIKEAVRGAEPAHWICPDCYESRHKSVLQQVTRYPGAADVRLCQRCGWEAYVRGGWQAAHTGSRSASRRR